MKRLLHWYLRLWCCIGFHEWERTQHFGERHCPNCGGSHWGHVVYYRDSHGMGGWKWYSAKRLKEIEAAGEMNDLICGTGKYGQD